MTWKKNRKMVAAGLDDLAYLPRSRSGWDATLACLAYGVRMDVERGRVDLNAWAARHAVPASARFADLGRNAWALWHGTSCQRAEKIAKHGLFHKRGVWAAAHPGIPHAFCRWRSERFAIEGAVICLLLNRRELLENTNFEIDRKENVVRFMHDLPAEVVEYVLTTEKIEFAGEARARRPAPWPGGKFKKHEGEWVPVQRAPVRYSASAGYSTAREFAALCLDRLLDELEEITALGFFSAVYSAARPWEALSHAELLDILAEKCVPCARRHKWQTFRRSDEQATAI